MFKKKLSLSRRSFILGGCASAIGSAALLSGCNHKIGNSTSSDKKNIVASVAYSSDNYNPVTSVNPLVVSAGWHIFEDLYEIDMHSMQPYNALAASDPIKIDELTYEIPLRQNAKFSDGVDVSAQDVVSSYNSATGAQDLSFVSDPLRNVSVKDKSTIRVELNYPIPSLLKYRLAFCTVVPASSSEKDLVTNPIGSGPMAYSNLDSNNKGLISLVPNNKYNGKFPSPDTMYTWNVRTNDDSRVSDYLSGSSTIIEDVPYGRVNELWDSGATVEFMQSYDNAYLMFNTSKSPFNNKLVRQAIHYAIDTNSLIEDVLLGHASAASCFLQKGHPNYHKAQNVYNYDLQKASTLIKDAGCQGLSFKLKVDEGWSSSLADGICDNLNSIGLNCSIVKEKINWSKYSSSYKSPDFDIILSNLDLSYLSPDADFLISYVYDEPSWMDSRSMYSTSLNNRIKDIQAALHRARQKESTQQQEQWNTALDIISEEVPIYPIMHREIATAYNADKVINFRPVGTSGLYMLGSSIC